MEHSPRSWPDSQEEFVQAHMQISAVPNHRLDPETYATRQDYDTLRYLYDLGVFSYADLTRLTPDQARGLEEELQGIEARDEPPYVVQAALRRRYDALLAGPNDDDRDAA